MTDKITATEILETVLQPVEEEDITGALARFASYMREGRYPRQILIAAISYIGQLRTFVAQANEREAVAKEKAESLLRELNELKAKHDS